MNPFAFASLWLPEAIGERNVLPLFFKRRPSHDSLIIGDQKQRPSVIYIWCTRWVLLYHIAH